MCGAAESQLAHLEGDKGSVHLLQLLLLLCLLRMQAGQHALQAVRLQAQQL